jgi:hypothetical protein
MSRSCSDGKHSAYRGLSPRARLGFGIGLLTWSAVGLYLSDRAEETFGFTPSDTDKAQLDRMTPRISIIDKESGNR